MQKKSDKFVAPDLIRNNFYGRTVSFSAPETNPYFYQQTGSQAEVIRNYWSGDRSQLLIAEWLELYFRMKS